MKRFTPVSFVRGMVPAFLWLGAVLAGAQDSSVVRLGLLPGGAGLDATGRVVSILGPQASTVSVQASRLTPGRSYLLSVGGIPEAMVTANAQGRASVTFGTPFTRTRPPLDFDPRGRTVTLSDGTNAVLQGVVSGTGEPGGISVLERAKLTRLAGTGQAVATYRALAAGRRTFSVKVERVTGTNWFVYVNGILRGPLPVRRGEATLIFDSNPSPATPNRPLLDFDPRGQVVDLIQGTNVMFSGRLQAKARNVNSATPTLQAGFIPSTGADPDGTARARWRVESDARRKFSLELEDVPAGAYELWVNGVWVAPITVSTTADGTEGEVEFSNRDDDPDELPLTFDPVTSTFTVQLGGTVYFQGAIAFSGSPGATNEPPIRFEERLSSTRLDPDADGRARYEIDDRGRRKFSVEVEDVAVGAYEVWIGGVRRGTLRAVLQDTRVEGELEWSTHDDDPDELPLTFDPRGKLIEVRNSGGLYFSHLFGFGDNPGGTNAVPPPARLELPLFNLGPAPGGSARAEFKRDDRGRRSFEVEMEDVPVGSYTLSVGGTAVGVVTVISTLGGTRGQLEFEDEPDGGTLQLAFDPLGADITLARDGTVYFQRTFPTIH